MGHLALGKCRGELLDALGPAFLAGPFARLDGLETGAEGGQELGDPGALAAWRVVSPLIVPLPSIATACHSAPRL